MKTTRRGMTLIELVIVLTLASLVIALATTTLGSLLRINKQINDDLAQDVAVARLASRWREDVHAAESSVVNGDCLLRMPDERTIRYRFLTPAVTREVLRGETTEHRDAFVLPPRARVTFSIVPEQAARLQRLEIRSLDLPDRVYAVPVRPMTIEAALHLHGASATQGRAP